MRPFLSQFEIDIPHDEGPSMQIRYDETRMILMIADRPAVERSERVCESTTRKTFIGQETTDDN
jgi:hypothetical protein